MKYCLRCFDCNYIFNEDQFYNECPKCGGMIDVIIKNINKATIDQRYDTIMRYHRFLPIENIHYLSKYESARPTSIIEGKNIARKFGFKKLLFKDETTMETGTLKDREGLITINRLLINNIEGLVLASSGNAGLAISWYASKIKGPKIYLFLPKSSRTRMYKLISKFTSNDVVKVTYIDSGLDETADIAMKFAEKRGLPFGTGFQNYSRREGVKTFTLEYLLEQKERVDWYAQGVAGALALYGFYKVHNELGITCPKIAGIQPSACSPLVDAYKDGAKELMKKHIPPTPVIAPEAPVLKTRNPIYVYPIIKRIIDDVNGYFEKVTQEEIVHALHTYYLENYFVEKYRKTGIRVGLEAATALAGIIKMKRDDIIKDNEKVLVNVSGAARPGDILHEWWPDI